MVERVGILGGTFDPVHLGHLLMAKKAMIETGLDRVVFVPNRQSPLKKTSPRATNLDRLNMLELATTEIMGFEVSDFEITKKGPSYTIETIKHLIQRSVKGAEIYFILGPDAFLSIGEWKDPSLLLSLLKFCVFPRTSFDKGDSKLLTEEEMNTVFFSIAKEKNDKKAFIFDSVSNISSSEIGRLVGQEKNISVLVPRLVEEYILRKHLYLNENKK